MKRFGVYIMVIAAVILLFSACRKETKTSSTQETDSVAVEVLDTDSLELEAAIDYTNWEGEYRGILPCEDCDGAETVIALNFDSTFIQNVTYIGRGGPYESSGTFTREAGNLVLNFDDGSRAVYKVEAGTLSLLDDEGEEMGGEAYVLRK